jgi:hypothetical protein
LGFGKTIEEQEEQQHDELGLAEECAECFEKLEEEGDDGPDVPRLIFGGMWQNELVPGGEQAEPAHQCEECDGPRQRYVPGTNFKPGGGGELEFGIQLNHPPSCGCVPIRVIENQPRAFGQ